MSYNDKLLYFPPKNFSSRFGDSIFTVDIVSNRVIVSDDTTCGLSSCHKQVVVYKIIVKRGKKDWFVERRYSDFLKLFKSLPLSSKFYTLNVIPPKTMFSVTTDTNFLIKRQVNLLHALDESLKDLSTSNSLANSPILDFLLLSSHPVGSATSSSTTTNQSMNE